MATVTPLRIGPADHGRAMTAQEFIDAEEDTRYNYELARGVLEVSEIPGQWHAYIVCHLFDCISTYHRAHPGWIALWGGADQFRLWVPEFPSGRHPDAAVVLRGAGRDWQGRRKPALAFEIVSEGAEARRRDYVAKREEYLAYGLLEYWIIDRFEAKVTVLTRRDDAWDERVFDGDSAAEGLALPGFAVRLAEFWAAAEEAERDDDGAGLPA